MLEKCVKTELCFAIHAEQRTLDKYQPKFPSNSQPGLTCVVMDSSGFGDFGIMVWRSPELKKNLYAKIIDSETIEEYRLGIKHLLDKSWGIKAIISDGKGLRHDFYGIPVQMCHFHQMKIITKYLTKNPVLKANIDLRHIALKLSKTDKESFIGWLNEWYPRLFLIHSFV